jgi:hypothetical protein
MERIGDGVRRELDRHGPSTGMAALVEAWPAAVGADVARNAWPARLARDGTLHVATSSSAWAFELAHLEGELVSRLRQQLGESAPPMLRFAPGPLPEPVAPPSPADAPTYLEPSSEARREAAALASEIHDEELRDLVARAAAASLARASSDRRF